MGEARRGFDDFMTDVKEQARDAKTKAQELKSRYVDDTWTRTRDYAVGNPGKTILISAAVGILLGSLLRRR